MKRKGEVVAWTKVLAWEAIERDEVANCSLFRHAACRLRSSATDISAPRAKQHP